MPVKSPPIGSMYLEDKMSIKSKNVVWVMGPMMLKLPNDKEQKIPMVMMIKPKVRVAWVLDQFFSSIK